MLEKHRGPKLHFFFGTGVVLVSTPGGKPIASIFLYKEYGGTFLRADPLTETDFKYIQTLVTTVPDFLERADPIFQCIEVRRKA